MNTLSIKCLSSETTESGVCHEQFLIDSLNPGQGITIGNQLRRVLLNDLTGIAISAVRIAGVKHEFSTIPGVREDILEILLNLKGIIFKSNSQETQFSRLKIQGPAVVTADAINLPTDYTIVNPSHYIATISTSNILEMEFQLESGRGYKLATQPFSGDFEDFLQTDAVFMPVQKVDFKIENVYDSNNLITERILLNIWTNGSLTASEALTVAIQNIINIFNSLLVCKKIESIEENELDKNLDIPSVKPYTNIAIEELQLSVRAYNCLKKAQINTVGDLLHYSPNQLQELKNFGKKSADEVFSTLKNKLGILLK